MTIHVVDSKQKMLSPNDIFIVAAHEFKEGLKQYEPAARKARVSPARLQYSAMIKLFQDPGLIRLREGNTMFSIKSLPKRAGFVLSFNADTAPNYINNLIACFHAARKLGFDTLFAQAHSPAMVRILHAAAKRVDLPGVYSKFEPTSGMFMAVTGEPRGD